jgi:hypothetical protein
VTDESPAVEASPAEEMLADWPSIERACFDMSTTLAWNCVYQHTTPAQRRLFRQRYGQQPRERFDATAETEPNAASSHRTKCAGDEELFELAYRAVSKAVESLRRRFEKKEDSETPVSFQTRNHLYSYLRKTLVTSTRPDGRRFSGIFTRLLRREIGGVQQDPLDRSDSAELPARADDTENLMMVRQAVARELQAWKQFVTSLQAEPRQMAVAVAHYFIGQLRKSCPDTSVPALIVLETWLPSRLEPVSLKAFKKAFLAANEQVTDNAFDSRMSTLRKRWAQWMEAHGVDSSENPVMNRLLTSQPSKTRTQGDD